GRDVRRQLLLQQPRRLYGQPARPLVSPSVRELRHPARDRLWSVGEQRAHLPNVGGSQESRHSSSSGRLGPGGRARMALLASPDVGVHRRALLKNFSVLVAPPARTVLTFESCKE